MTKKTKILLGIGIFVAIGLIVPSEEKQTTTTTKKEVVKYNKLKKDLNLITDLQEHFYNKKLTKKLLSKYPSFNVITKDYRKNGGNVYYLYSKKYNIELKVKNDEVVFIQNGSRFKH